MTKADLVAKMASSSGMTKAAAEKALNGFLVGVRNSLKRGQSVTLVGFGTFNVARRKPRKGRNPRTGLPITIPAAKVPKFRPSQELKKAIR